MARQKLYRNGCILIDVLCTTKFKKTVTCNVCILWTKLNVWDICFVCTPMKKVFSNMLHYAVDIIWKPCPLLCNWLLLTVKELLKFALSMHLICNALRKFLVLKKMICSSNDYYKNLQQHARFVSHWKWIIIMIYENRFLKDQILLFKKAVFYIKT